jgi:DNA-binding NarL/FixJ family response regulator
VLRLLRGSPSLPEIAAEFRLSPNMAKAYSRVIYRKFGVATGADRTRTGIR